MREKIAFVVAPLAVPLLLALLYATLVSAAPADWAMAAIGLSLVFAYFGLFVLGLPLYLLLKARGIARLWVFLAGGFVVAVATDALLQLALGVWAGDSARSVLSTALDNMFGSLIFLTGLAGLAGVVVAGVFWCIARPDRAAGAAP
ncbi:MAG TPA: hypothetical protein VNU97_16165 [Rhizomicrobium sp.]|jgi:hypothetical protein|nr:hypothetical protein [Rhizomicrobium sp.]